MVVDGTRMVLYHLLTILVRLSNAIASRLLRFSTVQVHLHSISCSTDPLTYHLLKLPSTEAINSIIIGKELGAAVTADGIIRIFRFPKEKLTSVAIKAIDTELQHVEDTTKPIKPANNHSTFVRSILHLVDGETALDSTGIGTLGATVSETGALQSPPVDLSQRHLNAYLLRYDARS